MIIADIKNYFCAPAAPAELSKQKEKYLSLFICSFLGMLVALLPCMIKNRGIFVYYGDFVAQQLMFMPHVHELVRSGNFGWDWGTDLGTGVVGTWSFYALGSPFFWLTIPFPTGWVIYMIPWILCLKVAVAAICAYAYLRRFIDNKDAAFVGAMLYAFSGFQTYNVFFNHFHDVTAFFPLLLLTLEMAVNDDRKGVFAAAVALMATVNYFFFVGEVVFIVIYFILRCFDKKFRDAISFSKLISVGLESVLGFVISFIVLLPSVLQTINNERVVRKFIGLDFILYNDKARIGRIFQAFFTLSDMPAMVNIFDVKSARWASLAGYLPLFSMCGVIAYYLFKKQNGKRDWLCWSLIVFTVMACIPFLNSAFILFHSDYYARWYYMPILLFCLMTAKVLDTDPSILRKGFPVTAVAGIGFLCVGLLPKYIDGKYTWFKLAVYPELYHTQVAVTLLMIVLLGVIIFVLLNKNISQKVNANRIIVWMTVIACIICNASEIRVCVARGARENPEYVDRVVYGGKNINLKKLDDKSEIQTPNSKFYRIDTSSGCDNYSMFWGLPSMRCFHSTVNPSIINFYRGIDQKRDVASRMDVDLYPLRSLLSVKYYFKKVTSGNAPKNVDKLEDFVYRNTQNKYGIYENKNFIPMGFAFDKFTKEKDIKAADKVAKTQMLLKALILDDDQISEYEDVISEYKFKKDDYTVEAYRQNCSDRRAESCYSFTHDNYSFTGKIRLDSPKLVFFSVPYDEGWSAKVNGSAVKVEKVNYGFMAVRVPAGDSEIVFKYHAKGQTAGVILTIMGILLLVAYILYFKYFHKKQPAVAETAAPVTVMTSESGVSSVPEESQIIPEQDEDSQETIAVPVEQPSEDSPKDNV